MKKITKVSPYFVNLSSEVFNPTKISKKNELMNNKMTKKMNSLKDNKQNSIIEINNSSINENNKEEKGDIKIKKVNFNNNRPFSQINGDESQLKTIVLQERNRFIEKSKFI